MLGIGRGARTEEVEGKTTPTLGWIEIAIEVLVAQLFAFEELCRGVYLLPSLRHTPRRFVAGLGPFIGKAFVGKHVRAIVEVVAIAVNRHTVLLASPSANGWLQVVHDIVHIELLFDPIWHL